MSKFSLYLASKPSLTRAVVCYLVSPDRVILGLRKKVSWGLGENLIAGVGGKVGDVVGLESETDEDALIREVQEELGVSVTKFSKVGELTFLFPQKPKWNQFVIAYLVTGWEGEPQETESIKPMEYPISELPRDQMWDDNQYWLPLVLSGTQLRGVFLFDDDNKYVAEKQVDIVKGFEKN